MLDISSINAVSGILAAIGVLVGVVFAVLQLRDLVKTRQTDLVTRLYSIMGSREFQEAWEKFSAREFKDISDYGKRYGWKEAYELTIFFEGIGALLHRKLIDMDLVDDLFTTPIMMAWEKMKPIAEAFRRQFNRPQYAEWFEYLYNEMQKREQQLATIQ